jgi:hypothetical protein
MADSGNSPELDSNMGSCVLEIDSIEIIDSIPEDEMQTGKHLYDHILDLRAPFDDPLWTVRRHEISSEGVLRTLLAALAARAEHDGTFSLIHLECHGAEDHIRLANGDLVTWPEISEPLRSLNRASRNRLIAVWAACEGIHSIKSIFGSITKGTPMRLAMGPDKQVEAGHLGDGMKAFYTELITKSDVDAALKAAACIEPALHLFKAENGFAMGYIQASQDWNTESKKKHVEDLVTRAKGVSALENVPGIHGRVKQAMKVINPESYFEQAKRTFFMLDQFPELEEPLSFLTFDYVKKSAKV